MAHVDIGDIVITPVADPTAGAPFHAHGLPQTPAMRLDIRPYAGGNFRVVRQKGRQKVSAVTLSFCTDAQVALLKDWQGQIVCFRDTTGEKFFGIYNDPGFDPRPVGDSWAVTLTVAQVTWRAT